MGRDKEEMHARCARPLLEGRIVGVELRRLPHHLELHVIAIVRTGGSAADVESHVIGAELAAAARRETYNLYRSLELKGVVPMHATDEQFRWLVATGVVKSTTHSVTLVPLAAALTVLDDPAVAASLPRPTPTAAAPVTPWSCLLAVVAEETAAC
jgi:hypothetical protein